MSVQQDLQGPSATSEETRMVLIVDDEPSMRTALSETVRRLGYQVRGAIDGVDAIEQIERIKPWLVVTDLKMPRLTGLELVKAIKQKSPQTFIVLMTAYGTVETAVEAMKYGANDYLLKPFSTDLLERVILNLQATTATDEQEGPATLEARAILTQDPGHDPPAHHSGGCRGESGNRADQRREWNREGTHGPLHPRAQSARPSPLRGVELCRATGQPPRERTVRSRTRRIYRSHSEKIGQVRNGAYRDAVSR
jgi:FixJ family two-component response regulator